MNLPGSPGTQTGVETRHTLSSLLKGEWGAASSYFTTRRQMSSIYSRLISSHDFPIKAVLYSTETFMYTNRTIIHNNLTMWKLFDTELAVFTKRTLQSLITDSKNSLSKSQIKVKIVRIFIVQQKPIYIMPEKPSSLSVLSINTNEMNSTLW